MDEASVDRLWDGIRSRRRSAARQRMQIRVAGALSMMLAAVVFVLRPSPRAVDLRAVAAGPIRTELGADVGVLSAGQRQQAFVFSDSSRVVLERGATLTPRINDGATFVASLSGGATFEVTPGGPRRWSIEWGLVTVDVIGTRFEVADTSTADATRVRVSVDHGIVLVRGERVPEHVQRLVDGQSIEVSDGRTSPPARATTIAGRGPSDTTPGPVAPRGSRPGPVSWHELARRGEYSDAYRALGARGLAAEASHASVEDLLALADVARLSAHPEDAVTPLRRVVGEYGADARAPLAAFTLGRVELDTLGDSAAAATAFQRAIDLGLPTGLVQDAYGRLVEADVKMGNLAAARGARDACARRYPECAHSSTMERWVHGD